jgi:predicted GNAT family N-acyltransferase
MQAIITDFESHREAIERVREEVFVVEQCIDRDEEFDDRDPQCTHVVVFQGPSEIATGRLDVSLSGTELGGKLGRVAVLKAHRRQGAGELVVRSLEQWARQAGHRRVWFHAQVSAVPFYEKLGYQAYGDTFMEANIPHVKMQRNL